MTSVRSSYGVARRSLRTLDRRARHLQERVAADPSLSFDKAELAALRWAISRLLPTAGDGFVLESEKEVA